MSITHTTRRAARLCVRVALPALLAVMLVCPAAFAKEQDVCPIMGGKITSKEYYADYEGKRVYFCCPGCAEPFLEDPAKFIKELEAQGVELDKTPEQ